MKSDVARMAPAPDLAVEAFKKARRRPAVLKLEIASLRSAVPTLPILVFEGDDDKLVYSHWIGKIRPNWSYASFPCGGKGQVLGLRDSMQRDVTGLKAGVYFIVDRDFDGLKGREGGDDIFITDSYSIENYLVTIEILDKILEIEFHCHAKPHIRSVISGIFEKNYDQFLEICKSLNERLYLAVKQNIDIKPLTDKISDIADISLDNTAAGRLTAAQIVCHVNGSEIISNDILVCEFNKLNPKSDYRGKFALMFFTKWLSRLAEQNKEIKRGVFRDLDIDKPFKINEISLNCLAARSRWPATFDLFVHSIEGPPPRENA